MGYHGHRTDRRNIAADYADGTELAYQRKLADDEAGEVLTEEREQVRRSPHKYRPNPAGTDACVAPYCGCSRKAHEL